MKRLRRAYRRDGDRGPGAVSDLPQGELLKVGQEQDISVFRRQAAERCPDFHARS
jgi:hypothetical protein